MATEIRIVQPQALEAGVELTRQLVADKKSEILLITPSDTMRYQAAAAALAALSINSIGCEVPLFESTEKTKTCPTRGRWVGMAPFPENTVHVGRNEDCPCRSGKKFKKCCTGLTWEQMGEKFAQTVLSDDRATTKEKKAWAKKVVTDAISFSTKPRHFVSGVKSVAQAFMDTFVTDAV